MRELLTCRQCGTDWSRSEHAWITDGGGCPTCAGSPLCADCGHPRRDHVHVYVKGGTRACRRRIGDFQTLSSSACACDGYVPVTGALADAPFAQPDPDLQDEPLPQLRRSSLRS